MKKRTAFIGAIISLIPFGQPLLLQNGAILSITGLMIALPENVYAESFEFYFDRGFDKGEKGDHYGAISDFTKVIELNPTDAIAYYNRGWNKGKLKDYYGAISDYTEAIKIDPNDTDLYVNRSIAKENIGDIKGASVDAKKAVSLGDKASDNKSWIKDNC